MNKIKNNLTAITTFLTGVVGHHYIAKILEYKSEIAASKEMELRDISVCKAGKRKIWKLSKIN